jgi:hypothetical protein
MTEIAVHITHAGTKRLHATYLILANANLKDVSFMK